ncbi:MAG: glycosyltransferase [Chloroflexi bacterium]|nr:glycosyltransferase [Chloroflexota bacterium]
MRILVVCTWCPLPPFNGAKLRAHYLLGALSARHDVTAVAFCGDDETGAAIVPAGGGAPVPLVRVAADPFRYTRLPQWAKFLSPVPTSLWSIPEMRNAVRQQLHGGAYDAIVAMETSAARYALLQDGAVPILDVDTALAFQMRARHLLQPGGLGRLRTWASWRKAAWYEGALLRRFPVCAVASDREFAYLRGLLPSSGERLVVVPNGVDCTLLCPGLAAPRPVALVYNGALTYSANYDAMQYFLSAIYPRIRRAAPEVSLAITGSTRGVDLDGLALDESVRLTGYVDDIRPVVAGSRVCVVPLREGGGTRLKILEAMALGTPVVSTAKGAEGLDVVGGEHLLLADDAEQFAALTVTLLRDGALRERLTANARRLVEQRYDWRAIGEGFVGIVEAAVERGKGARRHG